MDKSHALMQFTIGLVQGFNYSLSLRSEAAKVHAVSEEDLVKRLGVFAPLAFEAHMAQQLDDQALENSDSYPGFEVGYHTGQGIVSRLADGEWLTGMLVMECISESVEAVEDLAFDPTTHFYVAVGIHDSTFYETACTLHPEGALGIAEGAYNLADKLNMLYYKHIDEAKKHSDVVFAYEVAAPMGQFWIANYVKRRMDFDDPELEAEFVRLLDPQ